MHSHKLNPKHVEWSRQLFNSLNDGGAWGVPRSGLIFRRKGDKMVLMARMPHDPAMPITPAQLDEQQNDDIAGIVAHFKAAGIECIV